MSRYSTGTPTYGSTAKARWMDAVKAKMERGIPREQAMLQVDRENPKLRQDFLAEANAHRTHSRHSYR